MKYLIGLFGLGIALMALFIGTSVGALSLIVLALGVLCIGLSHIIGIAEDDEDTER